MTEELKRYGQASDGCMEIHDGGDWVSYPDYDALQTKLTAAEDEIEQLKQTLHDIYEVYAGMEIR